MDVRFPHLRPRIPPAAHLKWEWHTAKYGDPYSEFVLCIYQSKCTHTAVNTQTVNTHPEQWAAIYAVAPGEQLGVRYLAQRHCVMVLKVERALYIHSPHRQSLADRNSDSQPFNYESDTLPLGHDFPLYCLTHQRQIHVIAPAPQWKWRVFYTL